mgnify:CR=1 FL=1
MITPKEIFIVHPSVFHDAFRTDYETPFRQSSKDFFDLLLKHYREKGYKIAHTSWDVFETLAKSDVSKSTGFWIIPNQLVEIDLKSIDDKKLDKSITKLASKKCAKFTPYIVSTKDKIDLEGANFQIFSPKEAIDFYNKQGRF